MRVTFSILLVIIFLLSGCGSPNEPDVPKESNVFRILETIKTRGFPLTLDINENQLFVADNRNGLVIYDISDPSNLSFIERVVTPERAKVVKVEAGLNALFVSTTTQNSIYFLDSKILNSSSIIGDSNVNQILTEIYTDSIVNPGEEIIRVIKADGNDGVQVSDVYERVDIHDDPYFQKDDMQTLKWPTFIPPTSIAAINSINIVAVGLKDIGIGIADLSHSTSQQPGEWIASVDTPGEVVDVVYIDERLYSANNSSGFSIVDISDINNPALITTITVESYTHLFKVEAFENHLILMDEYKGVLFFDRSNVDEPVLLAEYTVREPLDAVFNPEDGLLYVASYGEGITVFELNY